VSRSLVSLVLRGSPSVSPGRREAVLRAVAELGYRPNATARVLAERKSNTVGVLLNDLRQPWFADMLDGLTPALHAGGKAILLGDGRLDRMMDEPLTWSFLDLGVDGLVLAGSSPVTATIINVAGQIPTVAVGGMDPDLPHVDVLANDNQLGGTLAVRHLVSLGHRRIAHISGLPSAAGRLRMQAYQDTMRAAGLAGQVRVETGDRRGWRCAGPAGRRPCLKRAGPGRRPCLKRVLVRAGARGYGLAAAGEREGEPQQAEHERDEGGDQACGQAATDVAGHQQDRGRDGQGDGGQAADGHHAGRTHQPFLLTLAEHQPVIGDRPDQQRGRHRGQHQAGQVQVLLTRAQPGEPGGKRQREQEPEQDLHAQARDPQFLEEFAEIAVGALRGGLFP